MKKFKKRSVLVATLGLLLVFMMIIVSMPKQTFTMAAERVQAATMARENREPTPFLESEQLWDFPQGLLQDEYDATEIIAEHVAKRTQTSRTFIQADGTYVLVDFGFPIHFQQSGSYVEIPYLATTGQRDQVNAMNESEARSIIGSDTSTLGLNFRHNDLEQNFENVLQSRDYAIAYSNMINNTRSQNSTESNSSFGEHWICCWSHDMTVGRYQSQNPWATWVPVWYGAHEFGTRHFLDHSWNFVTYNAFVSINNSELQNIANQYNILASELQLQITPSHFNYYPYFGFPSWNYNVLLKPTNQTSSLHLYNYTNSHELNNEIDWAGRLSIDVTNYVRNWMGQAIISISESNPQPHYASHFHNPTLVVRYVARTSSYNFTQEMGHNGTAILDLSSGHLSYMYNSIFIEDGFMPIIINHIHDETFGNGFNVGHNFRLNLHQRIRWDNQGNFFTFEDAIGERHHFDARTMYNHDLGLRLWQEGNLQFLVDRTGNSMVFSQHGFLLEVHQFPSRYGNRLNGLHLRINYVGQPNYFNVNNHQIASITNTNTMIRFEYTNGVLTYLYRQRDNTRLASFWHGNPSFGIKRLINETTGATHVTGFEFNNGRLARVFDRDHNFLNALRPYGEEIWFHHTNNRVTSIENRRDDETLYIEYRTEPNVQTGANIQTAIERTTVLNIDNRFFRHVSFVGDRVVSDYAFETTANNGFIPFVAFSNNFNELAFMDTYANTRNIHPTLPLRPNTNQQHNIFTHSFTNLTGTDGTHSYAISVWVKQDARTSLPSIELRLNGGTQPIRFFTNGQVTGWQFATITLNNVRNLNRLDVTVRGHTNNLIRVGYINAVRLPHTPNEDQQRDLRPRFLPNGQIHSQSRFNPIDNTVTMFHFEYYPAWYWNTPQRYPNRLRAVTETIHGVQQSRIVYIYNAQGHLSEIREYGKNNIATTSSMGFLPDGRINFIIDENGVRTNFTYNANGTITTTVVGSPGGSPNQTRTNTTEQSTGLLTAINTNGIITNFGYNDRGFLSTISHNNFTTNFAYNNFGNLSRISIGARDLMTFTYTPDQRNLASILHGNGQLVQYHHNDVGELTGIQGTHNFNVNIIRYGTNNHNIQMQHSTGVHYWHETRDTMHVTAIRNGTTNVEIQHRIPTTPNQFRSDVFLNNTPQSQQTLTIDRYGRPVTINNHNRFTVAYAYNQQHQMHTRTLTRGTTNFRNTFAYTNHRLMQDEFRINNAVRDSLSYTYHPNGNIHQVRINNVLTQSFYYDQHNRLTRFIDHRQNQRTEYFYDNGGNITQTILRNHTTNVILGTNNYQYTDPTWRDLLTSFNGQPITHDPIGNPLIYRSSSPGRPQIEFEWQNGRQLRQITNACRGRGMGTVTMEYDYQGRRTRKQNQQFEARYFWNGDRLIGEQRLGEFIWYFYDDQGIAGMNWRGRDYFFRRNILGDVIAIYNSIGTLMGTYSYDAWGNHTCYAWDAPGSVTRWNPFRWRGKFWDEETGFYYMHSRFYDPQTGRFINADDPRMLFTESKLAPVHGANLFMYAYNNPVMFRDDSGYGFLSWVWQGIVEFFQDTWHAVTNPSETLSNMWEHISSDPLRFTWNIMRDPMGTTTARHHMINSAIQGDWQAVGNAFGRQIGLTVMVAGTMAVGSGAKALWKFRPTSTVGSHQAPRSGFGRPNSRYTQVTPRGTSVTQYNMRGRQVWRIDYGGRAHAGSSLHIHRFTWSNRSGAWRWSQTVHPFPWF
ncbi:MAG: RHS repeat-associated core domain-containing protein [Firmicutes bacterium]|nr:RHS repeat-associated core domain-containing protein [Bacillota bacterium]